VCTKNEHGKKSNWREALNVQNLPCHEVRTTQSLTVAVGDIVRLELGEKRERYDDFQSLHPNLLTR
jgi:hypothetical protein